MEIHLMLIQNANSLLTICMFDATSDVLSSAVKTPVVNSKVQDQD